MRGYTPKGPEAVVPNYEFWSRKDLQAHVPDLEDDLRDALSYFVADASNVTRRGAVDWLADRFDRWADSGFGLFTISTAQEFEQHVAYLRVHEHMDVPPYAEMLLQPGHEMAFRHSEYMLARDLGFLFELYCDAESLLSWC